MQRTLRSLITNDTPHFIKHDLVPSQGHITIIAEGFDKEILSANRLQIFPGFEEIKIIGVALISHNLYSKGELCKLSKCTWKSMPDLWEFKYQFYADKNTKN